MSSRRTLRKPTRWTPEEWAQIEQAARACGVPPLRYVREAALGRAIPQGRRRAPRPSDASRRADAIVLQLGRVLNNLRQLLRVAEIDGDQRSAAMLAPAIPSVEDAISRAPTALKGDAEEDLAALIAAGIELNALAYRANSAEEVPPVGELRWALIEVDEALRRLRA